MIGLEQRLAPANGDRACNIARGCAGRGELVHQVAANNRGARPRSVPGFRGIYTNNDNLASHFSTLLVVR